MAFTPSELKRVIPFSEEAKIYPCSIPIPSELNPVSLILRFPIFPLFALMFSNIPFLDVSIPSLSIIVLLFTLRVFVFITFAITSPEIISALSTGLLFLISKTAISTLDPLGSIASTFVLSEAERVIVPALISIPASFSCSVPALSSGAGLQSVGLFPNSTLMFEIFTETGFSPSSPI